MRVATLVGKSNSLSLTRLLWKAIDKFGKPDMIKGDNGKDYLSKDFQSLLDGLNITYDATIAYTGEQKALVERRFGALQHAKISQPHGYIGKNLSQREMIKQKTPKKERKAKYEEFLFNAGNKELRVVGKKGINFEGRVYKSALMPSVGTRVKCVQNIDNIKELFIYDLNGTFLCLALDESIAKLSKESFKMFKKAMKAKLKPLEKCLKKMRLPPLLNLILNKTYKIYKVLLKTHS